MSETESSNNDFQFSDDEQLQKSRRKRKSGSRSPQAPEKKQTKRQKLSNSLNGHADPDKTDNLPTTEQPLTSPAAVTTNTPDNTCTSKIDHKNTSNTSKHSSSSNTTTHSSDSDSIHSATPSFEDGLSSLPAKYQEFIRKQLARNAKSKIKKEKRETKVKGEA